jgi:MFS family permease
MIAFPIVGSLVQSRGWRFAWLAIGIALIAVLAPLSWLFVRHSPESIGVAPDGTRHQSHRTHSTHRTHRTHSTHHEEGATWQEALTTPAFWIFSSGAALYGLVASGIGLFNESILAERGFGPNVYYQTLVVTALTALAGNFGGGWLAMRMPLSTLLAISLSILAIGLAALPHVTAIVHVMMWATAMGLGGGLVMVLFFSVWPRVYGRKHLGSIQGAAQAMTVVASAVGPLLLAWCIELTGSCSGMFNVLSGVIGLTAFSALMTPLPMFRISSSTAH